MNSYLSVLPWTRINEKWCHSSIDASPINFSFKHKIISGAPNSIDTRFQPDFYKKIALDIVAETVYNYPYPCITEKTLRPIACKKMFIIVGPANVLQLLRNKGFKTFDDIIDESYDSISDPTERFVRVQKSILDFVSRPLKEIQSIYKQKMNVFEHNFQRLVLLEELEIKKIYDTN